MKKPRYEGYPEKHINDENADVMAEPMASIDAVNSKEEAYE